MDTRGLLADSFGRVRELYVDLADGLDDDAAHHRPGGTGNSVAWLLWHVARVQDDHVAGLAGADQVWLDGWAERLGVPFDEGDIGYGHSSADVDAVRIGSFPDLVEYHEAVHAATESYLERVDGEELDRVVDDRWDPPVTAGVRVVSLLGDCLQHLGQVAYVRGLPRSAG